MAPPFVVTSVKQLRVIAAPGREELVDAVGLLGPCSAGPLASFLGKSRHALYYHLKALTAVGLLKVMKTPGQTKREVAIYDLPGRPFLVRYDLKEKGSRGAVIALGKTRFRTAARGFVQACDPRYAVTNGTRRNLWVAHWKGWLNDAELEEINALFKRLVKVARSDPRLRSGRQPHELTFAIAPVVSRRGRPRNG
jgi:DNA-binding transcriptional ArsR family regulator